MNFISSFAGKDGLPVLITVVAIILILMFAVKKGWVSFSGHGLEVGEKVPRELIRNQWEYALTACEAQFAKIRPHCKSDLEAKYLIAKVNDILQAAIVYNFMSENESYVKAKQSLVLNNIQKLADDPYFFSDDFKACCNRFVENLIKDLVRMKRVCS